MQKAPIVRPCPKCGLETRMTRHHIYPIRHFGREYNSKVFLLCRDCHDKLERLIPFEVMPKEFYPAIIKTFIRFMED